MSNAESTTRRQLDMRYWGFFSHSFALGLVRKRRPTGEKSPRDAHDQTHGVDGVGDTRHDIREAEKKPQEHHHHRLRMHIIAGVRVEFAFHPDITEQTVNDAGDAAEIGAAYIVLPEI